MPSSGPVLVVDDDSLSRLLLTRALEQAGFTFEAVGSGEEAIAFLARTPASIVLLDLMMPPPDGYAVLRILRQNPATKSIPVVVLTGLDAEEEVSRAFEMGADDFVRKPFKNAELIARIRSQLNLRDHVQALGRREHDARVVLELTQALASTLDFRNILYTVVRRIADVARVDRCSIVLVREEGKVGYVVAASDDRDLRDLPIDLMNYPEIRKVIETGEPLVIDDASTHPVFVEAVLPPNSFRSLAILPILYEDKPLGVLFLRGKKPGATREHELWVARTVASATAIALRNARMMQSLRDQTRESTYARFEAERKIRALEPYADFFHSSAEGIAVVDTEGLVLFSNQRASEITGRPKEELEKAPFASIIVPEEVDAFTRTLRAFGPDDPPATRDFTIVRAKETWAPSSGGAKPDTIAAPPMSTSPLSHPPVSTLPPSTLPLSTGPLSTGPLSTGPLSTGPLSTLPLSGSPLSSAHVPTVHLPTSPPKAATPSSSPLSTPPLSTPPLSTTPPSAPLSSGAPSSRGPAPPQVLSVSFVRVNEAEAVLLSFRDVTDDRVTALELQKTKEFLERVIDSSVDAIISADMKGTVLLFNRAAERCFGYLARDVVNQMHVRDLYPEGGAKEIMRLIRGETHGGPGRLEGLSTEILGRDGSRIPVSLSAALIFERGVPVGSVGVMTDLRDRLRMEASLSEAREELRQREKQALIAELAGAAAHELNQPLTSVLGYAEIMRRRAKLGQPITRETEAITSEAERMAEIVRKIGKITKYETKAYVGDAKIIDIEKSSEDRNRELR